MPWSPPICGWFKPIPAICWGINIHKPHKPSTLGFDSWQIRVRLWKSRQVKKRCVVAVLMAREVFKVLGTCSTSQLHFHRGAVLAKPFHHGQHMSSMSIIFHHDPVICASFAGPEPFTSMHNPFLERAYIPLYHKVSKISSHATVKGLSIH